MYQKILVPLDGSALAECVLPHVKAIANGCNAAEVVLLRVVEHVPVWAAAGVDYNAAENAEAKEAEAYLARIQAQLGSEGLNVKAEILRGQHKAAEAINDFVQLNEIDLLTIATHGRSGISRWVFGSVADKLVRASTVPVLLVRPSGCESGI